MRRFWLLLLVLAGSVAGADDAYQNAAAKIKLVREDRAAPGSRIRLSAKEINAYAAVEALKAVPQGLSSPRLQLGRGSATGHALVDFVQVKQSKGAPPNFLLAWLLAGERAVQATAKIQSGKGRAMVEVEEVRMGGVPARGAVLDFLVENVLMPFYPSAVIGKPFELKHRVERFDITPSGVTIFISK